ncbi:VOC family protein [Proteiniclasticum sp. C24MP]|uniref:VOC family protein n=1 Tax=Proteiniclasticum sp. C24MP TaxID=3374101 RepID=UPI003754E1D3
MALEVYLYFDGNAREAVEFYSEVFETPKAHIATYDEMPHDSDMPSPENAKDLVMNTSLLIQGTTVMFSDVYPGSGSSAFNKGNNVSLVISDPKEEVIRNLFDQLKNGGTVISELEKTFWSPLYGRVSDKFGIYWEIMVYDSETDG